MPKGEPPFPTIILPHGGPYVRETVAYDEWSQFLANRGYLVLQPQYRGSLGHGLEHWMSAFSGASQAGRKMQDDKDDGAMYLIEEGLAGELCAGYVERCEHRSVARPVAEQHIPGQGGGEGQRPDLADTR
jgi:hypothetical protein